MIRVLLAAVLALAASQGTRESPAWAAKELRAGIIETKGAADSESIVAAIAEFFHTGRAPVDAAQTLDVFEFMTAAQLSRSAEIAAGKRDKLRFA